MEQQWTITGALASAGLNVLRGAPEQEKLETFMLLPPPQGEVSLRRQGVEKLIKVCQHKNMLDMTTSVPQDDPKVLQACT